MQIEIIHILHSEGNNRFITCTYIQELIVIRCTGTTQTLTGVNM